MSLKYDDSQLKKLEKVLEQNTRVNFKTIDLNSEENINRLNWKSSAKDRDEMISMLLAYQRVLRFFPGDERAKIFSLIKNGLHSAVRIGSMSKLDFLKEWAAVYPGENSLGLQIYQNALKKRSRILLQYMDDHQNNEPHIKQTKIN